MNTDGIPNYFRKYWWIILIVAIIWLLTGLVVPTLVKNPGTFGDMFGSINALFSGIALGGIIITLVMQSHQLKIQHDDLDLQRNELKLTRDELARSANVQTQNVQVQALTASIHAQIAFMEFYRDVARDGTNQLQGITKTSKSQAIEHVEKALQKLSLNLRDLESVYNQLSDNRNMEYFM